VGGSHEVLDKLGRNGWRLLNLLLAHSRKYGRGDDACRSAKNLPSRDASHTCRTSWAVAGVPKGTLCLLVRLVGIDIGTTGCKALAIDETGKVLESATAEYPLYTAQPGWAEQNPEDWVRAAQQCLSQVGEYDSLGFTGQMHGSVFLDKNDKVIRPALLWNDSRTAAEVEEMKERVGLGDLMRITCNPPLVGFQAPKILWLRNTEPENFAKLAQVLLPKDFVRFALTGDLFTEVSDASGTEVFDVVNRSWSAEIMGKLGLDASLFPDCLESAPAMGAGDQAAGAVGVGAVTPEVVSASLGTSGVVFASQNEPTYDPKGRLHTFCHANGKWHSMSVMLSCGGALKWVRDAFGFGSYDEMAQLASQAKNSTATFKPYLAGERTPHNDPSLRGSFEGLSLSDGRAEIAKAVFDGVTSGLLDGFNLLIELRDTWPESIRVTGGGAKSDYWMQLIADTFRVPTVRLAVDEGPAFGAAILAGVGAGVWPDVETACNAIVRTGGIFEPRT